MFSLSERRVVFRCWPSSVCTVLVKGTNRGSVIRYARHWDAARSGSAACRPHAAQGPGSARNARTHRLTLTALNERTGERRGHRRAAEERRDLRPVAF